MELSILNEGSLTFVEISEHISKFKEFLANSTAVMNSYKRKPIDSIELLTYTMLFFEQIQKKNETDNETNLIIYNKLIEINGLWGELLKSD